MAAEKLSPAEVTEIRTGGGQEAWVKLRPSQTEARFTWRGKRYVATHSSFRLCIDNEAGEPVACRYD